MGKKRKRVWVISPVLERFMRGSLRHPTTPSPPPSIDRMNPREWKKEILNRPDTHNLFHGQPHLFLAAQETTIFTPTQFAALLPTSYLFCAQKTKNFHPLDEGGEIMVLGGQRVEKFHPNACVVHASYMKYDALFRSSQTKTNHHLFRRFNPFNKKLLTCQITFFFLFHVSYKSNDFHSIGRSSKGPLKIGVLLCIA